MKIYTQRVECNNSQDDGIELRKRTIIISDLEDSSECVRQREKEGGKTGCCVYMKIIRLLWLFLKSTRMNNRNCELNPLSIVVCAVWDDTQITRQISFSINYLSVWWRNSEVWSPETHRILIWKVCENLDWLRSNFHNWQLRNVEHMDTIFNSSQLLTKVPFLLRGGSEHNRTEI